MKKWIFKHKLFVVFGVLFINILLISGINLIEIFLELNKSEMLLSIDDILEDLGFYIILFCVIAPVFEETVFRLPLKKNPFIFLSLILSVIYLLLASILLVKIVYGVYLVGLIYLIFSKKDAPQYFIVISILAFAFVHLENYNLVDIAQLSFLEIVFPFSAQLILGIIVSLLRIHFSFKYAILYHALYNSSILTLALLT